MAMIFGGLGGLGLLASKELAGNGTTNIIAVSRSGRPSSGVIETQIVEALQESVSHVLMRCDCGDSAAAADTLAYARRAELMGVKEGFTVRHAVKENMQAAERTDAVELLCTMIDCLEQIRFEGRGIDGDRMRRVLRFREHMWGSFLEAQARFRAGKDPYTEEVHATFNNFEYKLRQLDDNIRIVHAQTLEPAADGEPHQPSDSDATRGPMPSETSATPGLLAEVPNEGMLNTDRLIDMMEKEIVQQGPSEAAAGGGCSEGHVPLVPAQVSCPEGHLLVSFTHTDPWVCDGCNENILTGPTACFICSICEYDLCERCVERATRVAQGLPPADCQAAEPAGRPLLPLELVTCPGHHQLSPTSRDCPWVCDRCSKDSRTATMTCFTCEECDYDLCEQCLEEAAQTARQGAILSSECEAKEAAENQIAEETRPEAQKEAVHRSNGPEHKAEETLAEIRARRALERKARAAADRKAMEVPTCPAGHSLEAFTPQAGFPCDVCDVDAVEGQVFWRCAARDAKDSRLCDYDVCERCKVTEMKRRLKREARCRDKEECERLQREFRERKAAEEAQRIIG